MEKDPFEGVDLSRLEEAVARARKSIEQGFEAGPETKQRVERLVGELARTFGGAITLGLAAQQDWRVRDALAALSTANEWHIRLESLLDQLGLAEQFVGLAFPGTALEPSAVMRSPMLAEHEATKYTVSAKIIYQYILTFAELPEFCRKDFGSDANQTRSRNDASATRGETGEGEEFVPKSKGFFGKTNRGAARAPKKGRRQRRKN